MTWVPGPPPAGEPRHVWLQLHDQGGHPFVVMGYLEHRWPEGYKLPPAPRSLEELRSRVLPPLVPWLRVPKLEGLCKPLSEFWNIDFHAEVELPAPA